MAPGAAPALGGVGALGAPELEGGAATGEMAPADAVETGDSAMAPGGEAGGVRVIPPCITDQATTAQAADCIKKAAEIRLRSPKSAPKAALNLAAIDYTYPQQKRRKPYRSDDPRVNVC
jgi:hypothetical protein